MQEETNERDRDVTLFPKYKKIRDRGFKSLWNFEKSVQSLLPLEPYTKHFSGGRTTTGNALICSQIHRPAKMVYTYFGRPSSLKLGSVIRPLLEGEE